MIIFCEECGARNDVSSDSLKDNLHTFECCECGEVLMVHSPSVSGGGLNAFADVPGLSAQDKKTAPVTVLIVDDSAVLRKIIREMFSNDDQMEIVGEAKHGQEALEMIPRLKPDVVTLDVNMPVMDGLTAIKHIMIKCPTPVVMFSTLTGQGSLETFEALRYGAVDFLQKPSSLLKEDLKSQQRLIISRVKNAARAGIDTIRYLRPAGVVASGEADSNGNCDFVYVIGSSYGAYGSLLGLIPELKPDLPAAFVSALHASPQHVDGFSRYLDEHSSLKVCRAVDGQPLHPGCCYLSSVFEAISVINTSNKPMLKVKTERSDGWEHAVDDLMASISETMKDRTSGILLSGNGHDGIAGIERIMSEGGNVIIQDPKTCLCNDTTAMVVERFGLSTVLPGVKMAETIHRHCQDYIH